MFFRWRVNGSRALIGVVARIATILGILLITGDAAMTLWQRGEHLMSLLAVVFFPVTSLIWPFAGGTTVFGVDLWKVWLVAVISYPISTVVGGLDPL